MTLKERVDRLENIVKTQDENLVKLLENLPMIIENILKEKDQKGMHIIDPHQKIVETSNRENETADKHMNKILNKNKK